MSRLLNFPLKIIPQNQNSICTAFCFFFFFFCLRNKSQANISPEAPQFDFSEVLHLYVTSSGKPSLIWKLWFQGQVKAPLVFLFLSVHSSALPAFLPVLTSIIVLTTFYCHWLITCLTPGPSALTSQPLSLGLGYNKHTHVFFYFLFLTE